MTQNSVLPLFVKRSLASEKITWSGTGERTQKFVHLKDLLAACLSAAETQTPGVYNIGGHESIIMKDLAQLIRSPAPGSASQVFSAGSTDPQSDYRWEIDLKKARTGLGYVPQVSLRQGLKEYIEDMQSGRTEDKWFTRQ